MKIAGASIVGVCLVLGLAAEASAGKARIGVSVGRLSGGGAPAVPIRGVFGRLQVGERLALALDLGREVPEDSQAYEATRIGGTALVDLGPRGGEAKLTPYLLAGGGVTRSETILWRGEHRHVEVGAGLDYALSETLSVGVEGRIGQRDVMAGENKGDVVILVYVPGLPDHQEYRSASLTLSLAL